MMGNISADLDLQLKLIGKSVSPSGFRTSKMRKVMLDDHGPLFVNDFNNSNKRSESFKMNIGTTLLPAFSQPCSPIDNSQNFISASPQEGKAADGES